MAEREAMRAHLGRKVEELTARISASPASLPLLGERGDACLFLGRFAEAVADFEKMIALDPAQDAPHWRLGIAYYFAGAWEKSSRQFAKYYAYDAHDRENGIWKFLADVEWHGLEAARREMLEYTAFDREPFPDLYDLLAGRLTPAQFAARLVEKGETEDPRVMFFADYYGGLNDEILGRHDSAVKRVGDAVSLYTPATGANNYMWLVAVMHYDWMRERGKSAR